MQVESFVFHRIFVTARFFDKAGNLSAISLGVVTSLLCLDREALPLTISFADCVLIPKPASARLDRALCLLGILSSMVSKKLFHDIFTFIKICAIIKNEKFYHLIR